MIQRRKQATCVPLRSLLCDAGAESFQTTFLWIPVGFQLGPANGRHWDVTGDGRMGRVSLLWSLLLFCSSGP